MERRDFLRLGVAAGMAVAAGALPGRARAAVTPATLERIRELSPLEMAEASGTVMAAWADLQQQAKAIRNPAVRTAVLEVLADPDPTLMQGVGRSEKKEIHARLTAEKLLNGVAEKDFLPALGRDGKTPQPFRSAPGSGYGSHHAYPGGLVTHTDLNVRMSRALAENYRAVFGYDLDGDVVLASQLLHDLHKPWVFQWGADGSSRTELSLAGTGEHHVLGVAESVKRGLPAEVVVAQACAHNHPRTPEDEAQVVGWLKAASILCGVDPVRRGLLESGGKTLPLPRRQEGFVCHLGDHDWVLSVPAAQWLLPEMRVIAERDYRIGAKDAALFNRFRNYVFSQASILSLYETLAARGREELARTVHDIVPA